MNARSIRSLLFVSLTTAASLGAAPAHAQRRGASTAEALFLAGREAVARGDYTTACARFAESDRLDPAAGTRINLADCEEHIGHVASAWSHWKDAAELLDPTDARLPVVKKRAAALEPRIPRLTLRLAVSPPPADVRIHKDSLEVGLAILDLPLPEDPGEHVLVVTAPDRQPREVKIDLAEGESKEVVLELGEPIPVAAPAPAASSAVIPGASTDADSPPTDLRPFGWAAVGVGAVGLGVGAVTGLLALGEKATLEDNCYPATVCNATGGEAAESGRTFATVSTVGFIAGSAFVVGGALLLAFGRPAAVAPPPKAGASLRPLALPRGVGLGLEGSF